jgi:hypothetical protein
VTREQAIAKIVKLAEITEERGASPAEEETAMRMGRRLIERFGLRLEEAEAAAREELARRRPAPRPRPMPPQWPPPFPLYGFPSATATASSNNQLFGVHFHVVWN